MTKVQTPAFGSPEKTSCLAAGVFLDCFRLGSFVPQAGPSPEGELQFLRELPFGDANSGALSTGRKWESRRKLLRILASLSEGIPEAAFKFALSDR